MQSNHVCLKTVEKYRIFYGSLWSVMKNLYNLHSQLKNNEIIFIFSGHLTYSILTGVAEMIEKNLAEIEISNKTVQNVFAIMIEQLQNVINYSFPDSNGKLELATCVIGKNKDLNGFFVSSGNIIKSEDKEKLVSKIDFVNSMDKDELRKYYKEQRKFGENTHSKGAGLGILEMARKVSAPLECTMQDIDDKYSYYTIRARV